MSVMELRSLLRSDRSSRAAVQILAGTALLIVLTDFFVLADLEALHAGGSLGRLFRDVGLFLVVALPALYVATFRPLLRVLDERKRSADALGLRVRELAARDAVNSVAVRELRTEAMTSKVLDVVLSLFKADGGWVLLFGPQPEMPPRVVGVRGVPASLLPSVSADRFRDSPTCCGGLLDRMPKGEVTLITECRHLPREALRASGFGGYVGVPLPTGHDVRAILHLVWRTPRELDDADRSLLLALARNVAIAAESAALYEAEQRAREKADLIASATLALNQTLDLEAVLQTLFEHLGRLVPYDLAKAMLVEGESHLRVQAIFTPADTGEDAGKYVARSEVTGDTLVSEVLSTRRSLAVPSPEGPTAPDRPGPGSTRIWLGVPLLAEGKAIGIVTLMRRGPPVFSKDEVKLVEAVTSPASVAISHARLYGEVASGRERLQTVSRKLLDVQEAERRHIARELHDEVGQTLTAIYYRLEALGDAPAGRNGILDDAIAITDRAIQSVRSLSLDLRPSLLDESGLPETLRWYVERQVRSDSLEVNLSVSPELADLPPEIRIACFRIVQEALTNVVRHSGAHRVRVQLRRSGSRVEVVVWDDGRGFDVEEAFRRARTGQSLGVLGMRERAELLGGELVFESAPGAGTTVKAFVPLAATE